MLKEDFLTDGRHTYKPPWISDNMSNPTPRKFQLKFLNIMDPLLPTNNLGRSVNRASFARVKRALDYGFKRLDAILEMVNTRDTPLPPSCQGSAGRDVFDQERNIWEGKFDSL